MKFVKKNAVLVLFVSVVCVFPCAEAADWPMWRYDPARTAMSPEKLPEQLELCWSRQFTPRNPCWPDPLNVDLMPYDLVFEPIVLGNRLFIGFNDADKVLALDTDTGETAWCFYTDAPVRLPGVARDGRVYFAADDGRLYCLDAETGALHWRFEGAPYDRRILGNSRLISTWPARGGPVLVDGVVYFGAGIWPFMGTFLYALDAATGEVVWRNEHDGQRYMLQPHNSPSFAGVAPHGAFVVVGGRLLIPGGRSVPACFNRRTGEFQYYKLAQSGKTGGVFVTAFEKAFFAHHREKVTSLYSMEDGEKLVPSIGRQPVLTDTHAYFSGESVSAADLETLLAKPKKAAETRLWTVDADASGDLIGAGGTLYAAGGNSISAIPLPAGAETPGIAWQLETPGTVERLLAANGKLFAVTLEGQILAFDDSGRAPQTIDAPQPGAAPKEQAVNEVRSLLAHANAKEGYALLYGDPGADFIEALVQASEFHVIAVMPEEGRVRALHAHFDGLGLYGDSVAVHQGDIDTFPAPPYLSSLTLIEAGMLGDAGALPERLARLFRSLRPYGGQAFLRGGAAADTVRAAVKTAALENGTVSEGGGCVVLERSGPLPGSASWTHMLGDVAQTGKSDDRRVKLPLGLLWFGGPSNLDVLPRHGHGPPEQVLGGRLFIEGMDCLSARDVYTGRVLWKRTLPDLNTFGVYYDGTYKDTPTSTAYNQVHIPGANIRGTNFVVTEDRVYVVENRNCRVLNPVDGTVEDTYTLPPAEAGGETPQWGYVGVLGDTLLGGADFVQFSELLPGHKSEDPVWEDFDASASKRLAALDRHTGEVHWELTSVSAFLHNGIAAGTGRVFCLDKAPPHVAGLLRRRGLDAASAARLLALDVASGETVWEARDTVFGSFLNYSEAHDILLQSTRPSRDQVRGEQGRRMVAYRGATGEVLWDRKFPYRTFPLIHNAHIITESGMFALATGEPVERAHPLTGERVPWEWRREYGCNYPIAAESLLTFRSGAAGFYDLANAGGTGNFGGFKSGCTANLVAADGVLNAPDYTRTCSCAYHNQASLAMAHMPEADWWTVNYIGRGDGPIARLGVNLGAPGDRRAENGTLWLEYPFIGGPTPEIAIQHQPEEPDWYQLHTSRVATGPCSWVGASGARGITTLEIPLADGKRGWRAYDVRLYFCEPDAASAGTRVFHVEVQGAPVAENLNVAEAAGGPRRVHVLEASGVRVSDTLRIALKPADASGPPPIISGVEAVRAGWKQWMEN